MNLINDFTEAKLKYKIITEIDFDLSKLKHK